MLSTEFIFDSLLSITHKALSSDSILLDIMKLIYAANDKSTNGARNHL